MGVVNSVEPKAFISLSCHCYMQTDAVYVILNI